MLFSFAGSRHYPKYATYLLEQVCCLELESSPAMKELFLRNWLVNTAGEPGRFKARYIMQERLNLELEEMLRRNDTEWDDAQVREVIAPNINYMVDLKNHWGDGLGLKPRCKIIFCDYSFF